jgi:hypothetical protein
MNIQLAVNRKCPLAFNHVINEFNYCQTSDCMSWIGDDSEGYCKLFACQCKHETKDPVTIL